MKFEVNPTTFAHVKPFIELDIASIEKATPEALQAFKAYLADPDEDVTGIRLLTLIDRANSLKRAYAQIESCLKRLQGEEG